MKADTESIVTNRANIRGLEEFEAEAKADLRELRDSLAKTESSRSNSDADRRLSLLAARIEELEAAVGSLETPADGGTLDELAALRDRLADLDQRLLATEQAAGARVSVQELAAYMMKHYADQLRGPQGPAGPRGEVVDPGDSRAATVPAPMTSAIPRGPVIVFQGKCLSLSAEASSISDVTFESGALICDGNNPRYKVQCASINPSACMLDVIPMSTRRKIRLRDGDVLKLEDIGDLVFYFTGFDNNSKPRKIFGGVSAQ